MTVEDSDPVLRCMALGFGQQTHPAGLFPTQCNWSELLDSLAPNSPRAKILAKCLSLHSMSMF